ncbi:MAG: hypothetical protein IJ565_00010 [Bacilli bacterium]|nr:hypothetical protein [Bacilli bacterium]
MKRNILSIIVEIVIALVAYYLFLPVINPTAFSFWAFVIFIIIEVWIISSFSSIINSRLKLSRLKDLPKMTLFSMSAIAIIIMGTIIIDIIVGPIFNAKSYSERISVVEGVFQEDIEEVDFSKVPLLDKASSEKVGDRIMGQYGEYVSQFYVSDEYTQINYNDDIIRVTPLEYDGFIKWLVNKKEGIGAYITVNSVNGEVKLVKLDKGMKYLSSAYFNSNLKRKLRFSYPFTIMGDAKFEIDNDGNPYYIVPTLGYTGVSTKTRVTGAIIFNPVTGESQKYSLEDIPKWVDNVYPSYLVIEQVNDWGTYRSGFVNSIFGQKNVVNTTEGYNYLALNDDIYLYTGITSVLTDESNLGFILTNLRTGKTALYNVAGAEEYSAMDSAEGQVQQMSYTSTFPLLINLKGHPTYLVSLKDNAGLVKMYGFVDVTDYQKVVVTDAALGIKKAAENYLNTNPKDTSSDIKTKEITIKKITTAVKDGNTYYYIVDTEGDKYVSNISVSNYLPFIGTNENITIMYYNESDITEIIRIEK